MSCWKRYQMLLFASMVWSILTTIRFSLSLLFIDCVRMLAQPLPLKRLVADCVPGSSAPFASSGQVSTGVGVPAVLR